MNVAPYSPGIPPLRVAIPWHSISVCAGVGGLDIGIDLVEPGHRTVAYVEREAGAAAALVASMEGGWFHPAPVWSDLGTFDGRPWRGRVHLVTSGDPCQPNSVAGRGLGAADDRFLIDQLIRVVAECRPLRVFRENVTGNADGQLRVLIPALEGLGYRCAVGIFSAAGVGASHERERLFVMADFAGEPGWLHAGQRRSGEGAAVAGRGGGYVDDAQCSERRPQRRDVGEVRGFPDAECGAENGAALSGGSRGELAHARRAGFQGCELGGACRDGAGSGAHGSATELRGAWLPPFAPGPSDARWPAIIAGAPQLEPAVRRMADGLAYRIERLRACGNGVFPLAAADACYLWTLGSAETPPQGSLL